MILRSGGGTLMTSDTLTDAERAEVRTWYVTALMRGEPHQYNTLRRVLEGQPYSGWRPERRAHTMAGWRVWFEGRSQ